MNEEQVFKLVSVKRYENKSNATLQFKIKYKCEHSISKTLSATDVLKFTHLNENGDIPLSGTFTELKNKFEL